jgi:hypothetical protein
MMEIAFGKFTESTSFIECSKQPSMEGSVEG